MISSNRKTALFAMSSLGLGHATRTLAIVQAYRDTHDLHIVCTGKALAYLKTELQNTSVTFYDIPDYPPLERGRGILFYLYLIIDSLTTVFVIRNEHSFIKKLVTEIKPEFIISDGRYGTYSPDIPSFLVSHQISFVMPRGLSIFQGIADYFNFKTFQKFDRILIPDYEGENNLAGALSHHKMLEKLPHSYVGILSSLKKQSTTKDIDYLFTVSGYLEEHKESFVSKLLEQAKQLKGKKVFILGNAENKSDVTYVGDIEIHSSVSGEARQNLYNRARYVVSRSGYTTIMDLVELGIPGYLIPTPGQTEQEYLAHYLGDKKFFTIAHSHNEASVKDVENQSNYFNPAWTTDVSIKNVQKIIQESTQ